MNQTTKQVTATSNFLKLYSTKKRMMNMEFLQWLDFKDIYNLSLVCFALYKIIDENRFIGDDQSHSCHLKLIASKHLLQGHITSTQQIDSIFQIDIKYLTDFQYLNGSCFKDVLVRQLNVPPQIEQYTMIQEEDEGDEEDTIPEIVSNGDKILHGWTNLYGKNVLDIYHNKQNPLQPALNEMKVDYTHGGFFNINHVRWSPQGQMFLDYQILIESIKDTKTLTLLQQIHEQSQNNNLKQRNNSWVDRETIKHALNGIGRITQYFNPTDNDDLDFNQPKQNLIWSVYEGQISEGIGHGFARIIYGDTGKSYSGYYKQGNKHGKGIQLQPVSPDSLKTKCKIQAEGIWLGNEKLIKAETISSFQINQLPEESKQKTFNVNSCSYYKTIIEVPKESKEGCEMQDIENLMREVERVDFTGKMMQRIQPDYFSQQDLLETRSSDDENDSSDFSLVIDEF